MYASEVIEELQNLIKEHGEREFQIYKSFDDEATESVTCFFKEDDNTICIGIYA